MTLLEGDCVEVMAGMEPESVDAIVCDPPYDLTGNARRSGSEIMSVASRGFMGKTWDGTGVAFRPETWTAALRVAKPGAHLLAFGGTRTYHRLTCAIEDAGWEVRDCLVWAYASGFPKSLNLPGGFGTALKPAWEPIVMARKPLRGTVAANVAAFGTGALNIDGTRIAMSVDDAEAINAKHAGMDVEHYERPAGAVLHLSERPDSLPLIAAKANDLGRWPANVLLTDDIFSGDIPGVVGGGEALAQPERSGLRGGTAWQGQERFGSPDQVGRWPADSGGTYSRFFLVPKAARSDREPVLGGLAQGFAPTMGNGIGGREHDLADTRAYRANHHPTVKPVDLMRHLVRLVTPPGGTVLDCFAGSGSTLLAAELEGFAWIGIEKEPEYVAIIEARLNGTQRGFGLASA